MGGTGVIANSSGESVEGGTGDRLYDLVPTV